MRNRSALIVRSLALLALLIVPALATAQAAPPWDVLPLVSPESAPAEVRAVRGRVYLAAERPLSVRYAAAARPDWARVTDHC